MKKLGMFAVMLTLVVVVIVPALAQDGEFDVVPAPEPVATCAWEPTEVYSPENPYAPNALNPSDHEPGELVVRYYSEEEIWAAPQENVVDTDAYTPYYDQLLYFEDIANISDPCERFAAEEAKRQEILTWYGMESVGYDALSYNIPATVAG